jgi:predicted thioesterase
MSLETLQPGLASEARQVVVEALTAAHVGSGTLRVYATPSMVGFVEEVCRTMVEPHLAPGETTVGVSLKIRHLAPTPVGLEVRCRAEVVKVENGVLTFQAEVWDPIEKIGEGEHKRAVIGIERFLKRVQAKAATT